VFFLPLSRFSALQGLTPRNCGSRVVFDRDFFLLFARQPPEAYRRGTLQRAFTFVYRIKQTSSDE